MNYTFVDILIDEDLLVGSTYGVTMTINLRTNSLVSL
jgi:hypothetical protein